MFGTDLFIVLYVLVHHKVVTYSIQLLVGLKNYNTYRITKPNTALTIICFEAEFIRKGKKYQCNYEFLSAL